MKKILYQLIILISLTSCGSTYFYSTLNSESENTWKDDDGYFITEVDSLDVIHSFKGENAPIMITVFNKSNQPVYIDWSRSAVIIDGVANSYNGSAVPLESAILNAEDELLSTRTNLDVPLSIPNNVTFIPPFSSIDYQTLSLANFSFEKIDNKEYQNRKMGNKKGHSSTVKMLNFSISDSPLRFRSYLTLYKDKDPKSPLIVDEEFYISSLIKTKSISPSSMHSYIFDRGDMFHIKIAPNNQFGEILLGTTLLVGVVVLDAALTNSSQDDCCY